MINDTETIPTRDFFYWLTGIELDQVITYLMCVGCNLSSYLAKPQFKLAHEWVILILQRA